MQYGAAGTRNLATGLVHWGYSNKRNSTNHDDEIDQTFLEWTLRQLHNETREDQEQEERRRTTGSGQNDNRERKVTRRESRNIKLQVEKIEGLTYDTIGTVRTLNALQQISQRSSWYHRAAETAKSILNFRQAASRRWINRGIEASKGVMWVGNSDEIDIDGIWDGMKIHAWKTNDAIKAAKLLLREYPPAMSKGIPKSTPGERPDRYRRYQTHRQTTHKNAENKTSQTKPSSTAPNTQSNVNKTWKQVSVQRRTENRQVIGFTSYIAQ